ncbi:MAG: hypothetical protein MI919_02520 [Holophagales bacterium]|nr:hypothetical protein [Holophagales bacterium]
MLATTLLGGCCLLNAGKKFGGKGHLDVEISPSLNGNSPVPVNLVLAYDADMEAQLVKLTAEDWFGDQGAQLRKDFPESFQIALSREWVPGLPRQQEEYRYQPCARSAVIFARYSSPGDHRQAVPIGGTTRLLLDEWKLVVSPSS